MIAAFTSWSERSQPRREWRDAERPGKLVELLDQHFGERHSVFLTVGLARQPALAGDMDLVEAGKPLGGGEVAHVTVDFRGESIERHEARDIERNHKLSNAGVVARRRREVADVAAERSPIERAGQQPK